MTATIHLDDASVNAVAERVTELLRGKSISDELIDAAEVARRFGVSRDYVYDNAERLGAKRLGDGPKARLRFDPAMVAEALSGSPESKSQDKRSPVRSVRSGRGVTLLPIRGESP
jgi:hypothetical protein